MTPEQYLVIGMAILSVCSVLWPILKYQAPKESLYCHSWRMISDPRVDRWTIGVKTMSGMYGLSPYVRWEGMKVYVDENEDVYRLSEGVENDNWVKIQK